MISNATHRAALAFLLGVIGCSMIGCSTEEDTTPNPGTNAPPPSSAGPRASSGFEASADGWTITGDAQADHVEPDYDGTGGNPDGLISAVDDTTGGVWYFQAPQQYLGDSGATYGRFLDFDLKTSAVSDPFDGFDVVLTGAGLTLGFDTSTDPALDVWTEYAVELDESAGWRVTPEVSESAFGDFDTLVLPTREQMKAVLGDLDGLLIRGEYENGTDTGYLDNVRFGASE